MMILMMISLMKRMRPKKRYRKAYGRYMPRNDIVQKITGGPQECEPLLLCSRGKSLGHILFLGADYEKRTDL